jgi:hypothetical protein
MPKMLAVGRDPSFGTQALPIGLVATVGNLLTVSPARDFVRRAPARPKSGDLSMLDPGLQPSSEDLDRVEALARAGGDHPLSNELVRMVATIRKLVAAVQMLASELDGDD